MDVGQRPLVKDRLPDWQDCRVTVMGLGRFGGGVAATRWLVDRGARVTVTDLRAAGELQESLAQLDGVALESLVLGDHPESAFADRDVLVVNPAVRPGNRFVERFREAGIVSSEIELLLSALPPGVTVIGVTGSNGKSTTSALIHHLLVERSGQVWLGGNIGHSLLPDVARMQRGDIVVLELSSFQLHYLAETQLAVDVAVVTNLTANHLDWHADLSAYAAAKHVLVARQSLRQVAILPADDAAFDEWRVRGQRVVFGACDNGEDGVFVEDGMLVVRRAASEDATRLDLPSSLSGVHQQRNLAAALAAVEQVDPQRTTVAGLADRLARFQTLPHRQEQVAVHNGIRFVNDSNATTPESTMAALESLRGPITLIAGGASKGVDLSHLAAVIRRRVRHVVLIGETAHTLASLIRGEAAGRPHERASDQVSDVCQVQLSETLEAAFGAAVALVSQGGIVLLSPACASFGMFRDYRDRGEQFSKLAKGWTGD